MKIIITESQFKTIIESEVPLQVRRRTFWFEDYLNHTLGYMDKFYNHLDNFYVYLEKVIEETIDKLYWGWFSEMDDTSDEWIMSANYISNYIRNNFYDKIINHFEKNKQGV
jgi:hypothetical protein